MNIDQKMLALVKAVSGNAPDFYRVNEETGFITVDPEGDNNYVPFEPNGTHFIDVFIFLQDGTDYNLSEYLARNKVSGKAGTHLTNELVDIAMDYAIQLYHPDTIAREAHKGLNLLHNYGVSNAKL